MTARGVILPDRVLLDRRLSPLARVLYGIINATPMRDPSRRQLTASTNANGTALANARAELVELGYVVPTRAKRRNADPRWKPSVISALPMITGYAVTVKHDSVAPDHGRQRPTARTPQRR